LHTETGEFDKAALTRIYIGKEIIYNAISDHICLVELDEEPPHEINKEALNVALEVALKTDSEIFDKAFIMRKLVIDGSNTSGFQRTVLLAQNGTLDINGKKVGVGSICLEEDAANNLESTDIDKI
jgi:glutamyl-tRNA(Gln) amidotransferase subunit E